MQETLDSGCRRLSIRQPMQETPYLTADAGISLSDSECRRLFQTADTGDYQRVNAGVSLSDSGCKSISIRQGMLESLYQTAEKGNSLSDNGCRSLSIRRDKKRTEKNDADMLLRVR